ncbi:SpoIIE family protein phosphatase [Streptomyces zhihengii]|uniref:SpoIIE family protein phosphatase n=1 Tax=Streptomyces zhihengii TaxID=1818004 RepID=A0ABS2ULL2_9ACTN|nr:SpoIIE family protein phosphatase [Streptomyces zhihengii]
MQEGGRVPRGRHRPRPRAPPRQPLHLHPPRPHAHDPRHRRGSDLVSAPAAEQHYDILLVEDDAGDALLVEELLVDTGLSHTLVWHKTLAAARTALAERPAACVLLDLHLPDGSGLSLVGAVQEAAPDTAVVVLTGLSETHAGVEALATGAQDYLVKGKVDPDLLQRVVRYAVQRKQAERAKAALQAGELRAQENARLERGLLPPLMLGATTATATTRYFPGRERALLGGDFLDVVETGDHLVHAVVGDVSGHGPDAAALGVCLRIAWRALVLGGHRGPELLRLLEQMLLAERGRPDMFTTCTLLTLDLRARTVTLHLAGHHEPLLTSEGTTRELPAQHGVALGIAPGVELWPATTVPLPPRGALTVYTDGLIEGHTDTHRTRLGTEGLLRLLNTAPVTDPDTLLDQLIADVRKLNADRHTDDLAILRLDWDTALVPAQPGPQPQPTSPRHG